MTTRVLVLDANILIRAVLGNKVRDLITTHSATVDFFTVDVCILDAEKYLPMLFQKRNFILHALYLLTELDDVNIILSLKSL